jgi:UDP-N-acetylmuramoylalanine-D-glutamate ligase
MATQKKADKAEQKKPKANAAAAAAPTASPPAEPPAAQPAPSNALADDQGAAAAKPVEPVGGGHEASGQKWTSYEIVDGKTQPVGAASVPSVHRLERAQALTELAKGTGMSGELVAEGIQSFKDTDGRTMNVVVSGGALYKQEV